MLVAKLHRLHKCICMYTLSTSAESLLAASHLNGAPLMKGQQCCCARRFGSLDRSGTTAARDDGAFAFCCLLRPTPPDAHVPRLCPHSSANQLCRVLGATLLQQPEHVLGAP